MQGEELPLGRGTCVHESVSRPCRCINDGWESLRSHLSSVEPIPHVVHLGVQNVFHESSIHGKVDGLLSSVHSVSVLTFKLDNTQGGLLTEVAVPGRLGSTSTDERRETRVVVDNLEIRFSTHK